MTNVRHHKRVSVTGLIYSLVLFSPLSASAQDAPNGAVYPVSGQVHSGWESRYFSEGRDALGGDALWASSVDLFWKNFAGRIWYASSPQQSYDELQLELAVGHNVGAFDLYVAYVHIDFPSDDLRDNELSAGLSWSGLPRSVEFATNAIYSFDAAGAYFEFALARRFDVTEALALDVSSLLGVNEGYVADGHDGATNFVLAMEAEYRITTSVTLTAHVARSWGIDRDRNRPGDELLIDFTHGGIGVRWSFGANDR